MRSLAVLFLFWAPFAWGADIVVPEPLQETDHDYSVPLFDESGYLVWSGRVDPDLRGRLWLEGDADRRGEAVLGAAARAALLGPDRAESARSLSRALPEGLVVDEVRVRGDQGGFFISLPPDYLRGLDDERGQFLSDLFLGLSRAVPAVTRHVLMVRDPRDGFHHPLDHFLPPPVSVPQKESELEEPDPLRGTGQPPAGGQGQPAGFLSGRSVFLSPGHGWYYSSTLGRWATQRGNTHNLIEDHSNAESVLTFLTHYLWNAGAGVYTCRERDMTPYMTILDNGGSGYSETGTWTTVTHASAYGGAYRRALVNATETAAATFVPTIPAAGFHNVYYWFRGTAENATDVKITIRHTGGSTVVVLNQERDGATWKDLGRFHFAAGSSPSTGAVTVSNQSAEAGNYVAADAVRLGGGTGTQKPFGEPSASGWPRFEESGVYHANFMGCPSATCGSSTVNAMPRYAAWENESWEDPVYISWHSNAYDGTGRGTSSFAYASGGWDYPFNGVVGGLELRNAVHAEIIADLRAGYDAAWPNRGLHTNWYGELNPSNNPEMPAALFEMAYHDNVTDAAHLRNPVFRLICARAVYQGIVKYFAARDGLSYTLLPEPPVNLRVRNDGTGKVRVEWGAPPYSAHGGLYGDAATGYTVYRSIDGLGFDNGTAAAGTSYTDAAVSAGTVYYYRVAATNPGGESFPTETLAVRVGAGAAPVLIVAGFDRMDHSLSVVTDDPYSTNALHRGYVDRMNSYRYILPFARAVDAYGSAFDSASHEAVRGGEVPLAGYGAVLWFSGEESTTDRTFDAAEQALLQAYLDGGGNLFASGAEIGWDLDHMGNGAAFYNNYLKADYAGDDAGTYAVVPAAGGIFEGNAPFAFDDGSHGEYDAEYPDRLTPVGGAVACLTYSGGAGGTAGVQYGAGPFKAVTFGFPFETVVGEAARAALMADILDFFGAVAADPCAGAISITGFPFVDDNDTTGKPALFNGYSCAPAVNEAGPEVIYRVAIDRPGDLTVTVTDGSGVDIDIHLLLACDPAFCVVRNDSTFTVAVEPGTYLIVCDTWTGSGGTQYPGPYALQVAFSPTPGDTVSPRPVGDSLRWDGATEAWRWEAVTQDRLGGGETMGHYELFRSPDPGRFDEPPWQTAAPFHPDPGGPDPGACWFYRVEAVDAAGNREGPVLQAVRDNDEAEFTGSWSVGDSAAGKYGPDYRYHATGGVGAALAAWSFGVRERGLYTVSVWYPQGANRSDQARFRVSRAGGEQLHLVNQRVNGGQWVALGPHWLESGQTYTVTLDDAEPEGFVVIADAVRWEK